YRNQKIGFIFQSYNLIPHLTVLANVELALTISGVNRKEKRQLAINALERVGLKEQINKKPTQMSGGQMQRVAIARAIVNNPDIILADEPTGALDSVTSVQIMDILKELSAEKLVIMVTHNAELAKEYSTRIIRLLDGEILSDSNPPTKEEIADERIVEIKADCNDKETETISPDENPTIQTSNDRNEHITVEAQNERENRNDKSGKRKRVRKKKSSMNFFTALSLSARNLITKKLRTFLTIFAGSIGIIGIALVLSISNGFTLYMQDMEQSTLSSFPVTISEIGFSFDMEAAQNATIKEGTYPSDNKLVPYDPSDEMGGMSFFTNRMTTEYVDYVKAMEEQNPDWAASVSYKRLVEMHLIAKTSSGGYKLVDNYSEEKQIWWQELLSDNFVQDYYDVIDGRYPENKFEAVLVVDSNNRIKADVLKAIGITPTAIGTNDDGTVKYSNINFSDLISTDGNDKLKFRLVLNDDYYTKTAEDGYYVEMAQADYEYAYNSASGDFIKIVGVIRNKQNKDLSFFNGGIGYLSSLTDYVLEKSAGSAIVADQTNNFTDLMDPSKNEFKFDFSEFDKMITQSDVPLSTVAKMIYLYGLITEEQYGTIKDDPNLNFEMIFEKIKINKGSTEQAVTALCDVMSDFISIDKSTILSVICPDYATRISEIGASTMPSSISIYPSSYEAKKQILAYLDKYNEDKAEKDQIHYTDIASTITNSMSEMIDIVSYVLIAFAAISLFVSSIMIAIITYISVLERTKEIGVLRSLGARKIDISNVFNAETMIIGASSGIFGVCVAAILNFPINAIITKLAGGLVENIAKLSPLHGILLVLLSIALTVVSGFIPAIIASKKDPVVALRAN
ncbi:MAG: ATP-binding cassette domain-containing protein, partial [Christensenellales bacterium]